MKVALLVVLLLAPQARADVLGEFDALLARQKGEAGSSCNKFRKKWHGVVKGGLTRDSASHVSKAQALEALKLLEKYPFPGAAQEKAWTFAVEHETELAALPDQKALLARMGKFEQPCEVFSRHAHRDLLLKDVDALNFSKKEKGKVDREARAYLKHGGIGTVSGLGMKLEFLADYLGTVYAGANTDALKAKATALRAEYEKELWSRVRAELTALLGELED
jgi:hypothetical protein